MRIRASFQAVRPRQDQPHPLGGIERLLAQQKAQASGDGGALQCMVILIR
jgi:hypothetical protein